MIFKISTFKETSYGNLAVLLTKIFMETKIKSNKDKTEFLNRSSYVKCPECDFVRNVTPKKHKDPSWDKTCQKCNTFKTFQKKFPIGSKFGEWTIKNHDVERKGNFTMINVVCRCGFETSVNKWTLETDKQNLVVNVAI